MPSIDADHDAQRDVLDASPNAIVAVDEDGVIVYTNPRVATTFGYDPAELLGQPIEVLVPDRVGTRHVGHRGRFLAHPLARPMGIGLELAGRRRDGSEFPVEISLSPVGKEGHRRVFATVVDITARKAAEDRLAESELRFRTVLEASPNAVVAVDEKGTITYANPRASTTFGYDPDTLVGLPIETLLPERVAERHVEHRSRFLADPIARPMGIGLDLAGRRDDGSEFPVEISLSPVDTEHGRVVFATVVDITARKEAEAQLLQAQKMESIGRLAGGIAHDFNNVLFAIRGYAEMLEEDLREELTSIDAPGVRARARAILDAADRATNLTGQLLAFSRRQIVSPRVIDLGMAIGSVAPMLRSLIGEHIQLALRLDPTVGTVTIDPGQLDQILINLAVNARDAMPDGGRITIETHEARLEHADLIGRDIRPGTYVVLIVSDTGLGMDHETREHAFEPFFTTKEQGKGTGLGLATIYGVVRQSGGDIWLYSEPGLGSSFKLYFPRAEGAVDAPASQGPLLPHRAIRVLVVEDDPTVRDMTTQLLGRDGHTVTAVSDAATALATFVAATPPFEVVVTDVIMPGMSGIHLAERLRELDPEIRIVLLSGYSEEALTIDRTRVAGAHFVSKPVTSRQLLDAVRAIASRHPSHPPD